ncbi:MAG: DNA-protecting protein DprA [Candidatus Marinimicrobia bacterium]|nr:DNA-protecting protein DprA [Candidatus Neomarinimicrobiota bacterium]
MTNELAWYKLLNVKGLGAKSLLLLYRAIKDNSIQVADIFNMEQNDFYRVFSEFGKGKFSRVKYENFEDIDDEYIFDSFHKLKENGVTILPLNDEQYPESIKKKLKANAPLVLFCRGYLPLLNAKNVSIVGSRSIDNFSLMLTRSLASNLANIGYNVVSGYAKGVDTIAHLGALEANGTTAVVLSLGMNHLSVKKDFKDHNWEQNTLFISQFLPFEKWSARNAMTRNKVVCGLSEAVIVMASGPERDEKGRMSGTFDAGKSALEMDVPVFVLSPTVMQNPQTGNEELIKLGGIEFKDGKEVLGYLQDSTTFKKKSKPVQLTMFG